MTKYIKSCTTAKPRGSDTWKEKHLKNLKAANTEKCEVILIGDSIVANLKKYELWRKFQNLNCVNFGIGGDRVENVLYRINNGEILPNPETKVVVLFVGTNNSGDCEPWEIYNGILECIRSIHRILPDVHIVLPTMLPRGREPNYQRSVLHEVNKLLKQLHIFESSRRLANWYKPIQVVEIHKNIVKNGIIYKNMMYDFLHLTNSGYNLCFSLIYDKLKLLLTDKSNCDMEF